MKNKSKKPSVFWRSYIILCGVLLIFVVAFVAFFYDFIKAFEVGRPEYAVREYVENITSDDVIAELTEFLDGKLSGYEAENAISTEVTSAMQKYELSYVRAFSDNTDDIPKYDVYCGEKILSLTLSVTDGGKYGFDNYLVTGVSIAEDWVTARLNTVSVIIPSAAKLTLNGKNVPADAVSFEFADESVSEFEADSFKLSMYEIADVFGDITASAVLDGENLPLDNPSTGVYSSVYDSFDSVYTVIAPQNAVVTLNGITLSDAYVTGIAIPTDAHLFESETDVLCSVYCINGLHFVPTVTAELAGEMLEADETNLLYDSAFLYPDSYKKSYTAVVPSGATLYCNGVLVGEEYLDAGSTLYSVPEAAKKYAAATEYGVSYTVTGLYGEPEFTAYNGDEACVGGEDDGVKLFYPDASASVKKELEENATLFTQLYVKYTYEGTKHTEKNYNAVVEHIKEGSAAYKTLESSYKAMIYNSNFKVDKLEIKLYDTVKYSSSCYGIKVDFDSHGKYYKYEKVAVGTYTMIWIVKNGTWELVDFIFS